MLKARVIALLVIQQGLCVQSIGFARYHPVGQPEVAVEHLNAWGVDEIVCLHMDRAGLDVNYQAAVARYARFCQVPLAVGGGVASLEAFRRLIHEGADKVVMNSALVTAPKVVEEASRNFGAQSVVASIDYRRQGGQPSVWIRGGREATGLSPAQLAVRAQDLGAGEILLTSIDRDGGKNGYDIEAFQQVAEQIRIPVILAGGAGCPCHLEEGLRAGAQAVAAGNYFHFVEHAVTLAKRHLSDKGLAVRLDSPFRYEGARLNRDGRLIKRSEEDLLHQRFVKIEPVAV